MTVETEAEKQFLYRQAEHEILQSGSIVFPDELKQAKNPTEAPETRENRK